MLAVHYELLSSLSSVFIIICCTHRFTWSGTKNKAYQNVVDIVGGQQKVLSRRERPHVVLDQAGIPIALTNGVTEAWP